MTVKQHLIGSAVTSAAFFAVTKSWEGTIACFLSGVLIDLDHVFDFILIKGKICRTYRELVEFCFEKEGKVYLFLHSYELLALLWIGLFVGDWGVIWAGIIFGMSIHVFLDQLYNPIYPLTYFLWFRWVKGFPKTLFFKDLTEEAVRERYESSF